jgi:hypothetical protein
MTWLITSNFFLFSAFFVIFNRPTSPQLGSQRLAEIFSLLIPLLGISICWTVWQLVRSATGQIDEINSWWSWHLDNYVFDKKNYPRLVGESKFTFEDWRNIYSILPFIMTIAWAILLCASLDSLINGFYSGIFSYGLVALAAIVVLFYIGLFFKGNLLVRK